MSTDQGSAKWLQAVVDKEKAKDVATGNNRNMYQLITNTGSRKPGVNKEPDDAHRRPLKSYLEPCAEQCFDHFSWFIAKVDLHLCLQITNADKYKSSFRNGSLQRDRVSKKTYASGLNEVSLFFFKDTEKVSRSELIKLLRSFQLRGLIPEC